MVIKKEDLDKHGIISEEEAPTISFPEFDTCGTATIKGVIARLDKEIEVLGVKRKVIEETLRSLEIIKRDIMRSGK